VPRPSPADDLTTKLHPRGRSSARASWGPADLVQLPTRGPKCPFRRIPSPTPRSAPTARPAKGRAAARTVATTTERTGSGDLKSTAAGGVAEARRGGKTACGVDASKSKSELYRDAKDVGIEGRSTMNKEQLIQALREHKGKSSSGEQATRGVSRKRRPALMRREPPSEGQPPRGDIDPGKVPRAPANARASDRCTIVYERSHLHGEFEVVVTDLDGSRRSVARSPAFRSWSPRVPRWRRSARVAHALLAWRLEACGWRPVDSCGTLHKLRLARARSGGMPTTRSVVTLVREVGRARFVAEELDTYGNPTPLLVSPPFTAHRLLPVRPSRQARAALRQVVTRMESEGWKVATAVGKDWYAISLWRPAGTDLAPPAPRPRRGRRAAESG
jgi:hypothetical protein